MADKVDTRNNTANQISTYEELYAGSSMPLGELGGREVFNLMDAEPEEEMEVAPEVAMAILMHLQLAGLNPFGLDSDSYSSYTYSDSESEYSAE